jgi:hypothetical protein
VANNNDNPRLNTFFIDITADDDLSEPMFKGHLDLCGLRFPSAFTGSTISFYESASENGTYQKVEWEGTDVEFTVTVDKTVMFDPAKFSGLPWLKIASDGNEAADRTIDPIFRDFNH